MTPHATTDHVSSTVYDHDEQAIADARAINEQLLLAGLREHELAEQLRRQLAFTTAVTNSLAEGVYALDRDGCFTAVNPAAEQTLGWTDAELRGRDAHEVLQLHALHSPLAEADESPLHEVIRSGSTQRADAAVCTRRDGSTFHAAYSAAPIVVDGAVVGAVVTLREMTEIRQLQEAQEEYLSLISHDLRAPLTAILGRAELLLRWLLKQGFARQVRSVEAIVDSGRRMNTMIQELLDRSVLESGNLELRRVPADLVPLVQQIVEQIAVPPNHERITIHADAQVPVLADARRIERVVTNLLTNALKFSSPTDQVLVRVYADGHRALVAITDHGRGIDAGDLPHLFEKHYRAQTGTGVDGSGLGLYISRLIIEAHGGRVWVESTVGLGSIFTFSLPLAR